MEQPKLLGKSLQFDEKIQIIKNQFFSSLDDYKKYYVYFNKNPEVNEFQNYYSNSKFQLQNISRDLFLITNNINKSIEDLDTEMSSISVKLEDEKKLNKQLLDLMSNFKNTQNGSEILIDDAKTKYNVQYYKNINLFVGIIIVSGFLSVLFKKSAN